MFEDAPTSSHTPRHATSWKRIIYSQSFVLTKLKMLDIECIARLAPPDSQVS